MKFPDPEWCLLDGHISSYLAAHACQQGRVHVQQFRPRGARWMPLEKEIPFGKGFGEQAEKEAGIFNCRFRGNILSELGGGEFHRK